jgi:hypothetical protein
MPSNSPFWKVDAGNPVSAGYKRVLELYAAELLATPSRQWEPDLWMHREGNRFAYEFVDGQYDTPMFPCRTIMRCPSSVSLGSLNHVQLYVGNGYCIRTHDFKDFFTMSIKLTHLINAKPMNRKKHFHVEHIQNVDPMAVLARAHAAIGRFTYSVFGAHCQNTTHWMLYGDKPATDPVSALCSVLLSVLVATVLIVIIIAVIGGTRDSK